MPSARPRVMAMTANDFLKLAGCVFISLVRYPSTSVHVNATIWEELDTFHNEEFATQHSKCSAGNGAIGFDHTLPGEFIGAGA